MAKIDWSDEAKLAFKSYVENGRIEFGAKTAKRWLSERKDIEWRLERFPESYPPKELLPGRLFLYRRCHLMNKRFKFIYYYDAIEDTVHIVRIWDTKMNHKALIRNIK
jgi:plasmid stabilization system protein ParE